MGEQCLLALIEDEECDLMAVCRSEHLLVIYSCSPCDAYCKILLSTEPVYF
jgi:hypothetical protein